MADCVATLQLGLTQWVRGDDIFILKVSENAKKKHRNAWLGWMRENQSGWGTNDPEPQAPKDKLACSIPPQPVACPTGLFMTKTELWKMIVVQGPRCRSRRSRAERRGIGRSAGRDVAGRDVAATQRAETRMNGDEMSGKGGTECMHTPEPAIAARCVGGCGAPDFLVEV